ncbi:MAG: accessory factor UbiK family protein [Gammaproteobacteria bacterium]|nr:accessory factor UbiK family protein [Gammaproteobacteria bacterium]
MLSNEQLGKLVQQVLSAIPDGTQEIKNHLHHALVTGLQKLDVVTREEFEIQTALLQRSGDMLSQLEQQVKELEKHFIKQ